MNARITSLLSAMFVLASLSSAFASIQRSPDLAAAKGTSLYYRILVYRKGHLSSAHVHPTVVGRKVVINLQREAGANLELQLTGNAPKDGAVPTEGVLKWNAGEQHWSRRALFGGKIILIFAANNSGFGAFKVTDSASPLGEEANHGFRIEISPSVGRPLIPQPQTPAAAAGRHQFVYKVRVLTDGKVLGDVTTVHGSEGVEASIRLPRSLGGMLFLTPTYQSAGVVKNMVSLSFRGSQTRGLFFLTSKFGAVAQLYFSPNAKDLQFHTPGQSGDAVLEITTSLAQAAK